MANLYIALLKKHWQMLEKCINMAGGDNRGVLYVASFTCPPVPLMSGHLSCTDTFAWSRGCPFMAGTTVCAWSGERTPAAGVTSGRANHCT